MDYQYKYAKFRQTLDQILISNQSLLLMLSQVTDILAEKKQDEKKAHIVPFKLFLQKPPVRNIFPRRYEKQAPNKKKVVIVKKRSSS